MAERFVSVIADPLHDCHPERVLCAKDLCTRRRWCCRQVHRSFALLRLTRSFHVSKSLSCFAIRKKITPGEVAPLPALLFDYPIRRLISCEPYHTASNRVSV